MDSLIGADLNAIFADPFMTVAVSIGNSSTRGFFDQQDVMNSDGFTHDAQIRSRVVTIKTGSLVGIAIDVAITVDGSSLKVRQTAISDDGLLQHLKVT
ncbi:MAG TPA: hypothetical protein VGD02_08925 [Gemmatimonadaceae bacterium]|jgi:hypothetical protein